MTNKKGAISVNMIVYIAIAVFVLVLVIGFTTGTFQNLWGQLSGTQTELDMMKAQCKRNCEIAQNDVVAEGTDAWAASEYATKTYAYDVDASGTVGEGETALHCWDTPLSVTCTTTKVTSSGIVKDCTCDATTDVCECR